MVKVSAGLAVSELAGIVMVAEPLTRATGVGKVYTPSVTLTVPVGVAPPAASGVTLTVNVSGSAVVMLVAEGVAATFATNRDPLALVQLFTRRVASTLPRPVARS